MAEKKTRKNRIDNLTAADLEAWLGARAHSYWLQLTEWIAATYPGTFTPEWLPGSNAYGGYLRYKKSKSFCSLIPEKGMCKILIVFGAREREKTDAIRPTLSPKTQEAYDNATTFHDGKWLYLPVRNKTTLADAQRLLSVKRKIRTAS